VTESVLSGGQRRSSGNWAYARTMPHCVAARARIHYEVDGEGEPLVLIAGTAFDLSFWDDLLPELRGFRVLRLDNRGAGLSDAPDEAFSIEQMADDVAAVMDAAGMPSAHVYGMSMGGLIAQDLAIRYPERVLSSCSAPPMPVARPSVAQCGCSHSSCRKRGQKISCVRRRRSCQRRRSQQQLIGSPVMPLPRETSEVLGASFLRNCATTAFAVSTRSGSRR
jgi:hypothetical protein